MKIEGGSNLLDQIFNLIARYVWKVHSDEHIHKIKHYSAGKSVLDIIGSSDIPYIISMIKKSKGMWDQDIQVQELGVEGMENPEKKLKPLFTSGSGQKRTQGNSLWNLEDITGVLVCIHTTTMTKSKVKNNYLSIITTIHTLKITLSLLQQPIHPWTMAGNNSLLLVWSLSALVLIIFSFLLKMTINLDTVYAGTHRSKSDFHHIAHKYLHQFNSSFPSIPCPVMALSINHGYLDFPKTNTEST